MEFCTFCCIVFGLFSGTNGEETFHEELLLRPLQNVDLLASFNFVTLSDKKEEWQHFNLLPRLVGEFFSDHLLDELDFTLGRGVWKTQFWGLPPKSTATGAQVTAFFNKDVKNVDESWSKLTNALSGQFCASLNFLDSTQAVSPKWSFSPRGSLEEDSLDNRDQFTNNSLVRFGTLAGENVCTENLTPWKKLLPCGSKRGVATLLNAGHIHNSKFHSLGLSLRTVCGHTPHPCTNQDALVELSLTALLILDPVTLTDNLWNSRDKTEAPARDFSIRSLFGIGLNSACPMAKSSRIFLDVTNQDLLEIHPDDPETILNTKDGRVIKAFNLKRMVVNGQNNLSVKYAKPLVYGLVNPPRIHSTRFLVGHGLEKGGIVTRVYNQGSSPLTVVFLDIIPWFLRVYLHTLKVTLGPAKIPSTPLMQSFTPGVDRLKPYSLELVLAIPAKSYVEISIGFEKSMLKWLEYPPDANKGFYIGSAVISAILPDARNTTGLHRLTSTYWDTFKRSADDDSGGFLVQLYTESLLVNLPTPDFSMPYNVICLACTVVALAFGPLHNITTKSLTIVMPESTEAADNKPKGVLGRLKAFFRRAPKPVPEAQEEEEEIPEQAQEAEEESEESKKTR